MTKINDNQEWITIGDLSVIKLKRTGTTLDLSHNGQRRAEERKGTFYSRGKHII